MNLLVTIWRNGHNVMTASITAEDAKFAAELKAFAEKKGYRVSVRPDAAPCAEECALDPGKKL